MRQLAARIGVHESGVEIADAMEATLAETASAVRGLPIRRVFFAEWLDPPFCAGHWLPEMIAAAGGKDIIGRSDEQSFATSWQEVVDSRPELVIAGPCGFGIAEAAGGRPRSSFRCRSSPSTAMPTTPVPGHASPAASVNSRTCSTPTRSPIPVCPPFSCRRKLEPETPAYGRPVRKQVWVVGQSQGLGPTGRSWRGQGGGACHSVSSDTVQASSSSRSPLPYALSAAHSGRGRRLCASETRVVASAIFSYHCSEPDTSAAIASSATHPSGPRPNGRSDSDGAATTNSSQDATGERPERRRSEARTNIRRSPG